MSRIQPKITQHTKEQENMTNSQVKIQPTYSNLQITPVLELLDFKAMIIIFLQEVKLNTFEMNKRKFEDRNRNYIQKSQTEISELKNTCEKKIHWMGSMQN